MKESEQGRFVARQAPEINNGALRGHLSFALFKICELGWLRSVVGGSMLWWMVRGRLGP